MELTFLNNNIIALAHTENKGTVLLINEKDKNNSEGVKCVSYQKATKSVGYIDDIRKATTFNAFIDIFDNDAAVAIDQINRALSNAEVASINEYLVN